MKWLVRIGLFRSDDSRGNICRATSVDELIKAYCLVHDIYVENDFIKPHPAGMRLRVFEALPDSGTFVGRADEDHLAAVVSVIIDSPDLGLPSDNAFAREIDQLRGQRRKICEGSNWLIRGTKAGTGLLAPLLRCAFAYARHTGCSDFLGAVSQGHVKLYEHLGFEVIGSVRNYSEDLHDPVVLVRLDVDGMVEAQKSDMQAWQAILNYFIFHNPFDSQMPAWSIVSRRLFEDPTLLTELFVNRGDLLSRCTPDELQAIRSRWGDDVFERVWKAHLAMQAKQVPAD